MMNAFRLVLAVGVMFAGAGCASLSARFSTQPPAGRSAAEAAQDGAQCEGYAKGQGKHQSDHYQSCMVARGYATNWFMEEFGWHVGVVQTRPHDAATVMIDMSQCDRQADDTKKSTAVPALTAEQARALAGQAFPQARANATRMLVFCLQERGYGVVPWVR